jgi:predicted Holliday junction resolvase-like endonuclease
MKITEIVKFIYIYLFSAIGLILIIIGSTKIVDLGLKTYVFKQADYFYTPSFYYKEPNLSEEEIKKRQEELKKAEEINKRAERQRTASLAISQIIVGLPLFLYHWRLAREISFQ